MSHAIEAIDATSPDADLPTVEPPFEGGTRELGDPDVGGVSLAGGTSSRVGERNTLLAPLAGVPLVRYAAQTLVASAVDPIVAVVGHDADRVRTAPSNLPVTAVHSPEYATG